jgi:predicted transcriptional regulator
VAERPNRAIALLAIHPRYADAILSGAKLVEFRKLPFRRDVSHVVIYCTSPVMRVVAVFEVGGVQQASPTELWKRYANVGGIERDAFARYFANRTMAVALEVARAWRLREPITLSQLRRGLTAPQSYCYLDPSSVARVRRAAPADAFASEA